jgi:hypothetical protein
MNQQFYAIELKNSGLEIPILFMQAKEKFIFGHYNYNNDERNASLSPFPPQRNPFRWGTPK